MQDKLVRFEIKNKSAIIIIDNPPLNVTSSLVRLQLLDALKIAKNEAQKIIITGNGKAFVAGADAKEFDNQPIEPHLPDIIKFIEEIEIPTIAAINGIALGGGLEIALACKYRIANKGASFGLPEVNLGIIPGAGGTQRLPRLIGVKNAIELITQAKIINATEAKAIGLIDEICEDLLEYSLNNNFNAKPSQADFIDNNISFEIHRENIQKKSKGQIAPLKALELIEFSTKNNLEDGLKKERQIFLELKNSPQSRALRHIFFAERIKDKYSKSEKKEIYNAIIVGGGNMGASIAYSLVQIGIGVTIIENDENAKKRAFENINNLYMQAIKRGKITQNIAQIEIEKMYNFNCDFHNLPKVDLVIEAIFEDLKAKQDLFIKLDKICEKNTIFATNTSYLDVNKIFENVENKDRVLGLHFFAPAHIMKLLEIVKAKETSEKTMASAFLLAKKLGKISVEAGVCDGFIGNRILTRYRQTTDILLQEGAMPWQIDKAMRDFGFAMGPYEVQDLSGLEIAYANRARNNVKNNPEYNYIPIADLMVEKLNRLGRKNSKGWYDYSQNGMIEPKEVEDLIIECSKNASINRKNFTQEEIQNIAFLAIIDEALNILEEGIAQTAADIDLVMVHGYSFPRWRGGPMQYANEIGFSKIHDEIESLKQSDSKSWKSSKLLKKLGVGEITFNQLNNKVA